MATVSASVSGAGYYVTADAYEALITAEGITELYLTDSDSPATDVVNVLRFTSCSVDGTFRGLNDDGTVSLEEDTPARAIVQVTGELQALGGGASVGTATWRVSCYPDRMVVDFDITVTGGTILAYIAPLFAYTLSAQTDADYDYAPTAGGAWTTPTPAGGWTARASAAGPFSTMTSHNDCALIISTYLVGGWSGTTNLRDIDDGTNFCLLLHDTAVSKSTTYYGAIYIEPAGMAGGPRPAISARSRCKAFLDPDNLDGSADDGDVVTGTLKTNATYDHDTDGFIEGEGAYAVTAGGNEIKLYFDRDPGITTYDIFSPVLACYGVTGDLVFAKSSTDGSSWSTLVAGTDFNIQSAGANRIFQYLANVNLTVTPLYLYLQWLVTGDTDSLTHGHALDAPGAGELLTGSPDDLTHGHTLDDGSSADGIAGTADYLSHAHALDAPAGPQLHVVTPDSLAHGHALDAPGAVEFLIAGPDDLTHGHTLDDGTAVSCPTGSPDDLLHGHSLDSVTVSQQHIETPAGLAHGHSLDATAGFIEVPLYLSRMAAGSHRISWLVSGMVCVAVDGHIIGRTTDGFLNCSSDYPVRGVLVAYAGDMPATLLTPLDIARVVVASGDAVLHHIDRQPDAGAWARIATLGPGGTSYDDGPLDDGLYHYRLVAEDEQGVTATSATADATISSVPDHPTGLDYAWDDDTKTLTLSWTASGSDDVAAYRVREGNPYVELGAAADWEGAGITWDRVFTTETGIFTWLVRAVDADGNEEQNISQLLTLAFLGASPAGMPAEPRITNALAAAGGRITVDWLYDPRYEDPEFSNAGYEARIYWDSGTGTIDFVTPLATVAMSAPDSAERFDWTSGVLVHGATYKYVVRIGTAVHPAGNETTNTDEHSATANTSVPSTPTLTLEII